MTFKNITAFVLCLFITPMMMAQDIVERAAKIDSFLTAQIDEHHIPALSVAIIENGDIKCVGSYGTANVEFDVPSTEQTSFQLASVTKLLSATAIAMLIEEGKLDLEEKVGFYVKDLPNSWESMRIKDLVAHQSGIVDLLALKQEFNTVDDAMQTAIAKPLDFEPGTKTVYAGGDYAVMMKVVENISGVPFQEFMSTYLFDKLGMKNSGYNNMEQDFIYRTQDMMPNAATTYVWDHEKQQQRIFSMLFPKWTYPAGGLFSSIEDLSKWAVALDQNTLLSEKYQDLLWTPIQLRDDSISPFGIGWIVDRFGEDTVTGHSGGPALADIMRLPEKKITVIVLTNQISLRPFLTSSVLKLYVQPTRN
ncbi:serine hydrolase domain-containing protein [Allomuricauda sp. CP2A]|jgi:CubicO group peptidase (beta-lactamase class C family)|uniref:serine hydrolase domain-containing protein n=1 Tax=Allomuricauda sp. CP2A TaxID=1848189 RepID=UPI0009F412AC|nr:serine hydrolase domain-containing protein [Muricauda sp. CP2A]